MTVQARLSLGFALCLFASAAPASATTDESPWPAIAAGNHIILIRHAIAPGTGDPQNFRLGDCSTQRNLSQAGRDQAKVIGMRMRENGIRWASVYSSQWCRALETAKLLGYGPVTELPVLNSFFSSGDGAAHTRKLRLWIAQQETTRPMILVTHQVNITALAGIYPASGEMVVMRRTAEGMLALVGAVKAE